MKKSNNALDDFDFTQVNTKSVQVVIIKNTIIVIGIIVAATLTCFVLRVLGIHESNYILTYNLAVLLIAYFTNGYLYGIIASVLAMLTFNFFFTEPYYTLITYSPEYPVTFVIMLIVALITSTLTARVKRESRLAETREKRINILYQIDKSLLPVKSKQQVLEVAARDIGELFGMSVLIYAADKNNESALKYIFGQDIFNNEDDCKACNEAFQSGNPCGAGTELFSDCNAYYLPISGQSGVLAVVGIGFQSESYLSEARKLFLDTIGTQIALVLEREQLYESQHHTKLEIMRERLRGDLLRAVSHDLRTPLTGILGSASTVLANYDSLSDDVKKEFMQGIYDDAEWLGSLVENILNVTRFAEGNIKIVKEMEAVEEIVAEAVSRVKKRTGKREISIQIPEQLIMIPVDGMLIEQVLVNLLDNAIKYTSQDSKVSVVVLIQEGDAVFEVSDEGPGIPESEIPYIFNRYYKAREEEGGAGRGFALGLTICKSIVQAHGGNISVKNKPEGGLLFHFTLPMKE